MSASDFSRWTDDELHRARDQCREHFHRSQQSSSWFRFLLILAPLMLGLGALFDIVMHGIDWISGIFLAAGLGAAYFARQSDTEFKANMDLMRDVSHEIDRRISVANRSPRQIDQSKMTFGDWMRSMKAQGADRIEIVGPPLPKKDDKP